MVMISYLFVFLKHILSTNIYIGILKKMIIWQQSKGISLEIFFPDSNFPYRHQPPF